MVKLRKHKWVPNNLFEACLTISKLFTAMFTKQIQKELTAKVLAGNVQFKLSLSYCLVFFIKLRLASVRSWHLIVAILSFVHPQKYQSLLERWPCKKRCKKRKQSNALYTIRTFILYMFSNLQGPNQGSSSVLIQSYLIGIRFPSNLS